MWGVSTGQGLGDRMRVDATTSRFCGAERLKSRFLRERPRLACPKGFAGSYPTSWQERDSGPGGEGAQMTHGQGSSMYRQRTDWGRGKRWSHEHVRRRVDSGGCSGQRRQPPLDSRGRPSDRADLTYPRAFTPGMPPHIPRAVHMSEEGGMTQQNAWQC